MQISRRVDCVDELIIDSVSYLASDLLQFKLLWYYPLVLPSFVAIEESNECRGSGYISSLADEDIHSCPLRVHYSN